MDMRPRLKKLVAMVPECHKVADIGTDHGYALISLVKDGKIKQGIASDNKKRPLEKARRNAQKEGVTDRLTFRWGHGLETIKPREVNGVIMAGMGAQLIKDLLEANIDVVESLDFILLQPAQNPEILREYLYKGPYHIIDEDFVREDRRFYEYMLVTYDQRAKNQEASSYRVGNILPQKNHPQFHEFIDEKIRKLRVSMEKIDPTSHYGKIRIEELNAKISELRRIKNAS